MRPSWPQVGVVLVSIAVATGLASVRPDPVTVAVRPTLGAWVSIVDGLDVRVDSAALAGSVRPGTSTVGGASAQTAFVLVDVAQRCGAQLSGQMSYLVVSNGRSYAPVYGSTRTCTPWTQESGTIVFTVQPHDLDGAQVQVKRSLGLSAVERVVSLDLDLDASAWERDRYRVVIVDDPVTEVVR